MAYFLRSRSITRSTWMRTLAIPLVRSTSTGSSCDFLLVNTGIVNFACLSPTLSEIVKSLSAMTIFPVTKNSKKPHFSGRYVSEVLPPQASDTKEMLPWRVIPIRTLPVLCCLYDENVWALASKLDGRSMNTSKQSMTTVTFLPRGMGGGQETRIGSGTFFLSESSNKKWRHIL